MTKILRCLTLAATACVVSTDLFAQTPPDWSMKVRLGKPLYVTLLNGDRLEGLAGSVTEEGIAVATPVGVRTAKFGDIRIVERRDGPWNGVLTGALVGAGIGLLAIAADDVCGDTADFGYDNGSCSAEAAAVPVAAAIYGGLIGWGIDTLIKGRTTLFDSKGQGTKLSFAATPDGVRGRVTFSW
jgi:hypothetical protein